MVRQGVWLLFLVAVGGALSQGLSPDVEEARRSVGDANNAFSIDLYQAIKSQPGNCIVSPLSASAVLALVMQGAGGRTAQQLLQTLRLPADEEKVRKGYSSFFDSLRENNNVTTVRIANKVYAAKGSHVKAPFRERAVQSFQADAEELDFARKTEESKRAMNAWVEQITDNKIQNLITDLDPSTVMVLINAIYFKGSWVKAFEEEATYSEPFHLTRTSQVNASMMHTTDSFAYGSIPELNARVIELPYQGDKMKMLIILPDEIDGLAAVEAGLNTINFRGLSQQLDYGEVRLTLPKFKIESTYQLHETLPQMGVTDLFTPGACNLTGITDEQVVVSKVIQKAFVEVTETGTVAAAATAVLIAPASAIIGPPPVIRVFKADHPFIFFLQDTMGNIMFVGRVSSA